MTPEEARKLLGGFATGTLTESEERALFLAALADQALFDELAGEQALRDLMRDPAAKARLLSALDEPRQSWWRSWKPAAALAMAGVAAVAVVVGTRQAPAPVEHVAALREVAPPAPPAAEIKESAPAPPRRDVARPQPKRKFEAPASVAAPATAPVELAEAPKVEPVKAAEATLSKVEVTAAAPPMPPRPPVAVQDAAANPMFERASEARVRAFAGAQGGLSARAMFLGATSSPLRVQAVSAQSANAQPLGLRYSIVRQEGQEAPALRITSNVNGFLSVGGATPVSLTAMRPHTTGPLTGDEVKVVFSRQPETSVARPAPPLTEVSDGETYAVIPGGAPLSITIPLKQP